MSTDRMLTKTGLNVSNARILSPRTGSSTPTLNASPSVAEKYWAARALTAEALLSTQAAHHRELKTMSYSHDIKRARELATLAQHYKEKHSALENLVIILVTCLLALVVSVMYLTVHFTRHTTSQQSRWTLPSHFTIPILSPFASVVEHETSVIGSKSITILIIASAGLVYMLFRYQVSRKSDK